MYRAGLPGGASPAARAFPASAPTRGHILERALWRRHSILGAYIYELARASPAGSGLHPIYPAAGRFPQSEGAAEPHFGAACLLTGGGRLDAALCKMFPLRAPSGADFLRLGSLRGEREPCVRPLR